MRGYSVKVRVAAEAIGLARAGGIFVPANAVLALREMIHASGGTPRPLTGQFTMREAAVVEALRKVLGASNGALLLWDYAMFGVVTLHWTLVLTVALGCFIVRVMKGPAYVADTYPLPDDNGASITRP